MTKTELYNKVSTEVLELLESQPKLSKAFKEKLSNILDTNLMPKSGAGNSANPPKEIDGIMHYYCRFHQRYEPQEDMVISKGKSKGYCKASISLWNKLNSQIKKLDSQAVEAMANGDFEKAQELAKESKALKDSLNSPETYDYERDWLAFKGE